MPSAIAAVRAAHGRPLTQLRLASLTSVVAIDGDSWQVTRPPFPGLMAPGEPNVFIVATPDADSPVRPVWVGEVAGRFVRLDNVESLAAFFGASPGLPCETRARLVAINLGPRGGERVLLDEEEVESTLAELSPTVAADAHPFVCRELLDGAWELEFLGAILRMSGSYEPYRLTCSRWHVEFDSGGTVSWTRVELIADAVLERYRID